MRRSSILYSLFHCIFTTKLVTKSLSQSPKINVGRLSGVFPGITKYEVLLLQLFIDECYAEHFMSISSVHLFNLTFYTFVDFLIFF